MTPSESCRAILIGVLENLDEGREQRLLDQMRQLVEEQRTERRLSGRPSPIENYWRWHLKRLTNAAAPHR